eukprot:GHVR01020019.1.p1 GENE.GHVR01020019.1~~GHVR01020019.1.p1  ORF type:complete len:109 (+),score=29.53 GHVR01020019.1:592-918(+)
MRMYLCLIVRVCVCVCGRLATTSACSNVEPPPLLTYLLWADVYEVASYTHIQVEELDLEITLGRKKIKTKCKCGKGGAFIFKQNSRLQEVELQLPHIAQAFDALIKDG